ncbi:MAG: Na+/H+ antiporter NhaA [Deltaproteobacteria bacterium]|nr:Na+/H+ antiporter NhaA [Deltaproteobacteria bacterium]
MCAALAAVVWANSPWGETYTHLLHLEASVGVGDLQLSKSVSHWINDGVMGIFFFLVGLEIKREVIAGDLSSARKAALPATAAVGGMVVPALLYVAVNRGGPGMDGWGIPMATDIAFALGMLALLGDRVPLSLKVFLTALAIVDDIGAVLVIAVFYTDTIVAFSLVAGLVLLAAGVIANRAGMRSSVAYFILGTAVWLAFLKSGVHATIAGMLMAFTIPARTRVGTPHLVAGMQANLERLTVVGAPADRQLNTNDEQHVIDDMARCIERGTAPLQRLEHALVPVTAFFVLPLFALANAGVAVQGSLVDALRDPIALGIIVGLFLGKPIGIFVFAWLAVKLRLADLPAGVSWLPLLGTAMLGGVGFTMSLFIGGLAFADPAALDTAKVGILAASLLSGALGLATLWWTLRKQQTD